MYASQGLRVLVVASRIISELLWAELNAAIEAAEISNIPGNIRQAYSAVECNLTLMGNCLILLFVLEFFTKTYYT